MSTSQKSPEKQKFLKSTVEHIDPTSFDARPIINSMAQTAFQARNLARAVDIYNRMLEDSNCSVILTLAGSLISAGQKKVVTALLENNMVDAICSTGANIVDQDFFEALGFKHYQGTQFVDDQKLRALAIDRIYDTYIDEDELRICDDTIGNIINEMKPGAYSSREIINEMGAYLERKNLGKDSIIGTCHRKNIPIFCPAFSDCSAGFGFVMHQNGRPRDKQVAIDSARDFLELTKVKIESGDSGLLMLGGGVPKNFVQDTVVSAELLGVDAAMHKYAIQITVADERDGALSGSTLKEACSWGKVDTVFEQMVYAEATLVFPLLASAAYHEGKWKKRNGRQWNAWLNKQV